MLILLSLKNNKKYYMWYARIMITALAPSAPISDHFSSVFFFFFFLGFFFFFFFKETIYW